ncbi:MAG: hypothetical protein GX637_01270 [Clostridiales bacterium]|nr:hypothetical protein [Clostridiales bacterium]
MGTRRLYEEDAYLTEFDARVIAVRRDGWAALDRSAFYPTSGGQPHDTGLLICGDTEARVTDVEAAEGLVWHRLDRPLAENTPVHGAVDWERRLDHMQQHAADHMLAGAAWQQLGGVTIGLHTGREDSSIDMRLPDGRTRLTDAEIDALEDVVNRRVQRDDPIRCWFPAAEELPRLPLRKPPTVQEHVRVVAMGDYEMVPCGGTHPSSTGQIGPVKILSCAPARGNMRLSFVAGMRAIRYFQETARCARAVAAALSCGVSEAPCALQRERESAAEQRREAGKRLLQAALTVLQAKRQGDLYRAHLAFADPETLLRAALEIVKHDRAVALLSCPRGEERHVVFARGSSVEADMAALMRQCGARGGGKRDLAQGTAADGGALQRAAEALARHLTQISDS